MNVLLLSIGAKRSLVSFFKDTSSGFDKIITTDCSPYSAGLYNSDSHYIVPRMTDPNYLSFIIDICKKENIDAVIPSQEDELLLISKNRETFERNNISVLSSDFSTIELCKDKYRLYKFLTSKGIPCVPTFLHDELSKDSVPFPVFIKPRCGAGSIGNMKVSSQNLLDAIIQESGNEYIIQPFQKATEYGVDVYVDLVSSEITDIFIKEKLRMRAGETEKSLSVHIPHIEAIVKKIASVLPLRGPIDMDFFFFEGNYSLLEINPRFGGGYPHAIMCGVNFPRNIANNLRGLPNENRIGQYKDDVVALKYTQTMSIDNN